jgi:hypothetical protein
MDVDDLLHASASLPLKESLVPIEQEGGWSGPCGGKQSLFSVGILSTNRPARNLVTIPTELFLIHKEMNSFF